MQHVIDYLETHDVAGLRTAFQSGVNPNSSHQGVPLLHWLIRMYMRSLRFPECFRAMLDAGLVVEDAALRAVLADDAAALTAHLQQHPSALTRRYTFACAYTPLDQCTLLHICSEFNLVHCGRVLLAYGADPNARAGTDGNGWGGQTPIFYTVNQNRNQSFEMLEILLAQDVRLDSCCTFVWGAGLPWETLMPCVNPISYCMMGNLPQMHRDPVEIAMVLSLLLSRDAGKKVSVPNVPNAYLNAGAHPQLGLGL